MKMNWRIRIENLNFWLTLIPAVLLLVQYVAALFGLQLDLNDLQQKLLDVVNAIFGVLAVLGVCADHTTPGIGDSVRALKRVHLGDV